MKTLLMILVGVTFSTAQVMIVTASVEYGHLPDDERGALGNLAEKIEQYFNGYEWVDDEYETDVVCNIKVIIEIGRAHV